MLDDSGDVPVDVKDEVDVSCEAREVTPADNEGVYFLVASCVRVVPTGNLLPG